MKSKWWKPLIGLSALLLVIGAAAWYRWGRFHLPEMPRLDGSIERLSLTVDGIERTLQIFVPGQLERNPALVFGLHGSMGNGDQFRKWTGYRFDELAVEHGFLVVYPDGFDGHWNGCRKSGPYRANRLNIDDPAFFRKIVDHLAETYRADRGRVFATGFSNGGHMTYRAAIEMPDLFRAAAPICANLPTPHNMDCTAAKQPIAVMIVNGSADPINPYSGGRVTLFGAGNRGTVFSARNSADYFAHLAGYAGHPESETLPDIDTEDGAKARITRWREPGKPEISLVTIEGGGHTIPSKRYKAPKLLGPTCADFEAADLIWEFFSRGAGRR
ncbi:MAG: PHB depolymerase family esterase [Acidobacteriota bacterium]|nr:PHB depolymerase family esterase [Acidobacteriota bacterium]